MPAADDRRSTRTRCGGACAQVRDEIADGDDDPARFEALGVQVRGARVAWPVRTRSPSPTTGGGDDDR